MYQEQRNLKQKLLQKLVGFWVCLFLWVGWLVVCGVFAGGFFVCFWFGFVCLWFCLFFPWRCSGFEAQCIFYQSLDYLAAWALNYRENTSINMPSALSDYLHTPKTLTVLRNAQNPLPQLIKIFLMTKLCSQVVLRFAEHWMLLWQQVPSGLWRCYEEASPYSGYMGDNSSFCSRWRLGGEWSRERKQHISRGISFLLSAYKLCAVWGAGKRERTDVCRHYSYYVNCLELIHQKVITLCSVKNLFLLSLQLWEADSKSLLHSSQKVSSNLQLD